MTASNGKSTLIKVLSGILAFAVVFVIGFGSGAAVVWFVRQGNLPALGGNVPAESSEATVWAQGNALLQEIRDILRKEYIEPEKVDDQKMIYGAATGMVAALGDPHTSFVEPAMAEILDEDMQGSFEGIGATVNMEDGQFVIVRPMPGSPAEKAGLKAGDHILAVDGVSLEGLTLTESITRIRGPRGSVVRLLVQREGVPEPFEIEVTRDKIVIETVEYRMLEGNIAYVRLTEFNAVAAEQLDAALKELITEDTAGLVFDLRDNPGGYLQMAVAVASEFLPQGALILTERVRDEADREFRVQGTGRAVDVPLVVLVNGGSASASEIVAGAIQEHGRGILVGETTYGKGSVQQTHTLQDGSSLRVTVARWLLPNGKNLDGDGIVPDVEVVLTPEDYEAGNDPQLDTACELLRQQRNGNGQAQ